MAQGLVSLLSLFLLSATVPTGLYAFTCPHPSIATFQRSNAQYFLHAHTSGAAARHRRSCTRQTTDLLAGTPEVVSPLVSQEDRLREEGVDGVGRAQLAESISEEFRVRVNEVRQTYDVRLEQERASHRLEMARQRVKLLQGMVPLSAHEAVVESYEASSKAALKETAAASAAGLSAIAGKFSRREQELRAQVRGRDAAVRKASSDLRGMSESLDGLKRDVSSLRAALGSHASRAEEARRVLLLEIREMEVEPQRKRADAAETELSELRQATHNWLAAAHALKLEAAAEAHAKGYLDGHAQGRAEAELEAEAEKNTLRTELHTAREALSGQLSQARRERLALVEEVATARSEAVEMVAAVGAAGTAALTKSRTAWLAEGRAEGFAAGLAHKTAGESADVGVGGAAGGAGTLSVTAAVAEARESETRLREAFAAYVVSAHEQKLGVVAKEKEASAEVAQGLSSELASAREMLAGLLQERIAEIQERRDSALDEITAAAAAAPEAQLPLNPKEFAPWPGSASAVDVTADALKVVSSSSFWQECGGGGA